MNKYELGGVCLEPTNTGPEMPKGMKLPEMPKMSFSGNAIKIGLIILVVLLILGPLRPWVIVPAGNRGVVLQLGAVSGIMGEGFNFRIPFIQQIVPINVQVQKAETEAAAASKDLQIISSKIALNYHVDPATVSRIFQQIGIAFESKVIDPAVQEAVKAITARYTAEELITKRQQVALEIQDLLTTRLRKSDIIVDAFSIVNFEFSAEFNKAIELKQTAEQMALKAQRDLQRIRIEAEQKIAGARAEAEALRIQKAEVTPELIRLREIEVQKLAVDKWDGKMPQVTGGGAMPFINVK
jgi:regulator of protease activity HflC (stomatin/prohibitin superfamily)